MIVLVIVIVTVIVTVIVIVIVNVIVLMIRGYGNDCRQCHDVCHALGLDFLHVTS